MATPVDALVAMAKADAGLTALIGSGDSARIDPGFLPQNSAKPALTYRKVSDIPVSAMGNDTGLSSARISFNLWATSYESLETLREAFRAAMRRKRGTYGGVVVQDTFLENDFDDDEIEPLEASGGKVMDRGIVDVLVWYTES